MNSFSKGRKFVSAVNNLKTGIDVLALGMR